MGKGKASFIFFLLSAIIVLLVAALIVSRIFFIESRIVVSDSMAPTLLEGDRLVSMRLSWAGNASAPAIRRVLGRSDIVVIRLDREGDSIIKRIIGLPGESIELKADGLYVNGEKLVEGYIAAGAGFPTYGQFDIPQDGVFVLGDHRESSRDSREFGIVRIHEIKEKVLFRFFPLDRFGFVR